MEGSWKVLVELPSDIAWSVEDLRCKTGRTVSPKEVARDVVLNVP